jgi:hypothetical protein
LDFSSEKYTARKPLPLWKPSNRGYTAKNAEAMLDAALKLIKTKGGKV